MIVIEGVDLSGKTTLAKYIAERYGLEYVHLGRPEPGVRHWVQACNLMQEITHQVVCDRLVIGSKIYGEYLQDEFNYKPVTQRELDEWVGWMRMNNGIIIYARCSLTSLRYRYAQRGDPYLKLQQLEDIRNLYEPTMRNIERVFTNMLHYNSDAFSAEDFCDTFDTTLKHHVEQLNANS